MIYYQFNVKRIISVVQRLMFHYPGIDKEKISLLLYLIERDYLLTKGELYFGDVPFYTEFGPFLYYSYHLINHLNPVSINEKDLKIWNLYFKTYKNKPLQMLKKLKVSKVSEKLIQRQRKKIKKLNKKDTIDRFVDVLDTFKEIEEAKQYYRYAGGIIPVDWDFIFGDDEIRLKNVKKRAVLRGKFIAEVEDIKL